MQRLRLHLTRASLQLIGPAPWTIRINDAPGQTETWQRYGVGTKAIWDTIVAGLSELGIPLPPDSDWEAIKADIEKVMAS